MESRITATVWTVTTDIQNVGNETRAYGDRKSAQLAVAQFCHDNWDQDIYGDLDGMLPMDAVQTLRNFDCPNLLWLDKHDVSIPVYTP